MITYSNLNFPENGHEMWLSINLQRIDQWSMIFQLQGIAHEAVEFPKADWLFLGDRFLALDNKKSRQSLAAGIRDAKHVVINDLVHNYENQLDWIEQGLPGWMPERNYILVTNSQLRIEPKPWLEVCRYDFLFNRTKAYYSGFPFTGDPWYFAGHHNYTASCVRGNADGKRKIFISPCRLYLDQNRTLFREKLFDLMSRYAEYGYRSGPGRVKNGARNKTDMGLYLASSVDDPFINYRRMKWGFDPISGEIRFKKNALKKWRGSRWSGYNPIHNRYFEDTFISIYAETLEYGSNVVITEKTYDPLIKGHFILPFGSHGLVHAIRQFGFLLPEFINYEYDEISDDAERYRRFEEEVKRLMRFPMHRWRALWKQNIELLRHNQRLFHVRDYDQLVLPGRLDSRATKISLSNSRNEFRESGLATNNIRSKVAKIGFIGLGKLGLPCAEAMAEHHFVEGFDIHPTEEGPVKLVGSIAEACADKDVIFISVPTPHDPEYGGETPSSHLPPQDFDYSIVMSVIREIRSCVDNDPLVVLISTVLPGTVRALLKPLVGTLRLIYNPYLVAMGSVKWDMVNPEMLIIGTEAGERKGDTEQLLDLYQPLMQNDPRTVLGTWEEAECIKIFYNTFISTKISFVNMIQDVAERIGNTDVDVVTSALTQSDQRITSTAYMTAGMGDGGACHPRDNIALRWLASSLDLGYDLFEGITSSREKQASNLAARLIEIADKFEGAEIWIHGKAYKPLVSYLQGSYSLLVAHYIQERGRSVQFVDPLTGNDQESIHGVVLLAHAINVTYRDSDLDASARLYCKIKSGSVIVDPWRQVCEKDFPDCTVVHYGNSRFADEELASIGPKQQLL